MSSLLCRGFVGGVRLTGGLAATRSRASVKRAHRPATATLLRHVGGGTGRRHDYVTTDGNHQPQQRTEHALRCGQLVFFHKFLFFT